MKKTAALFLAAVLTAGMLTACRRSTPPIMPEDTTVPLATIRPTLPETVPTEASETRIPIRPTEAGESADLPDQTIEDGNGPTPGQMADFQF